MRLREKDKRTIIKYQELAQPCFLRKKICSSDDTVNSFSSFIISWVFSIFLKYIPLCLDDVTLVALSQITVSIIIFSYVLCKADMSNWTVHYKCCLTVSQWVKFTYLPVTSVMVNIGISSIGIIYSYNCLTHKVQFYIGGKLNGLQFKGENTSTYYRFIGANSPHFLPPIWHA